MPELNKAQRRVGARATMEARKQGGIWKPLSKKSSVVLKPFDREVYNSIEGKEHMFLREKSGTWYTIAEGNRNIGTVGFIQGVKNQPPFFKIGIIKEFRGKGFLSKAYKELAKKHGFKRAYVDIEKTNKKSVEAHEKSGFKLSVGEDVGKEKLKTDVRMYKNF